MGHTITFLNSFNAGDLSGVDAVILQSPYSSGNQFSAGETTAIQNFIASGRGMLALGESGGSSSSYIGNMNGITSGYGAIFGVASNAATGHIVSMFETHAVTAGLSSVGVDYHRTIAVSGSAQDLTTNGGLDDFLAVLDGTGGAGNSAFLGDASLWIDDGEGSDYSIDAFDNNVLLRNIVNYIIPAPSAFAALACGGLFATRRRRAC